MRKTIRNVLVALMMVSAMSIVEIPADVLDLRHQRIPS